MGWLILFILIFSYTIGLIVSLCAGNSKSEDIKSETPTMIPLEKRVQKNNAELEKMISEAKKRIKDAERRRSHIEKIAKEIENAPKYGNDKLKIAPEEIYKWEKEEATGIFSLVFIEKNYTEDFTTRYPGHKYKHIEKGEDTGVSFYIMLRIYCEKINAPISGIFCFIGPPLSPGVTVATIDPRPEAEKQMQAWLEKKERERKEMEQQRILQAQQWKERREKYEKEEIARKIKEKYRKRQLEKLVRQELIDSGELFGDQPKRPPIPREVVDAVYKRDGGRCVYCGSTENLQIDHIIPFSKGGSSELANLQLLCRKCNLEKSNKIG